MYLSTCSICVCNSDAFLSSVPSAAPVGLNGTFASPTSLIISWSPPPKDDRNGVILGYNVTYYPLLAPMNVTETSVNETFVVIPDLEIYTEYSVSVAAFTAVGTGPFASVMARTDSSGECEL